MRTLLQFTVCCVFACACGEASSDATIAHETGSSPATGARDSVTAIERSSTPITIDKGEGCIVVISDEGRGRAAGAGDEMTIDYVARVKDSETPFASTKSWTTPCRVTLGAANGPRVVSGLARGLEGLRAGAKATITVPPALAYGKEGLPSSGIPADATLVFEVEVSGVRR